MEEGKVMLKVIIIAASLMAEAEGEGESGIYSVADTIANRMDLRQMTAVQVVEEKPRQYATLTPEQIKVRAGRSPAVWAFCLDVARRLDRGIYIATTPWTHFYNPAKCSPAWAAKMTDKKTIKNHIFGRLEA
jgi:spore germination cell wall hydrolase CwlJ-like protein